ncbi:hypothetical protein BJ138DRAFT_1119236 [Hygrophoropsis aurantiaca]|uniref:Uncharacterized protein n=1 Tax=Hygrophoropsis aurantiaca TaxID=72124 RepID=A0ACB7ZV70_9AGAM|nr:hypothetical protein BJ138DRAFT_1119236 [Hygrophoropsis aurantiaca]
MSDSNDFSSISSFSHVAAHVDDSSTDSGPDTATSNHGMMPAYSTNLSYTGSSAQTQSQNMGGQTLAGDPHDGACLGFVDSFVDYDSVPEGPASSYPYHTPNIATQTPAPMIVPNGWQHLPSHTPPHASMTGPSVHPSFSLGNLPLGSAVALNLPLVGGGHGHTLGGVVHPSLASINSYVGPHRGASDGISSDTGSIHGGSNSSYPAPSVHNEEEHFYERHLTLREESTAIRAPLDRAIQDDVFLRAKDFIVRTAVMTSRPYLDATADAKKVGRKGLCAAFASIFPQAFGHRTELHIITASALKRATDFAKTGVIDYLALRLHPTIELKSLNSPTKNDFASLEDVRRSLKFGIFASLPLKAPLTMRTIASRIADKLADRGFGFCGSGAGFLCEDDMKQSIITCFYTDATDSLSTLYPDVFNKQCPASTVILVAMALYLVFSWREDGVFKKLTAREMRTILVEYQVRLTAALAEKLHNDPEHSAAFYQMLKDIIIESVSQDGPDSDA